MRLLIALTVQPPEGDLRFFNYVADAAHVPRVGDSVAIARWPNTSPGSSPITATVTAVRWNDLAFQDATVFLRATETAITAETLIDAAAWRDEAEPY